MPVHTTQQLRSHQMQSLVFLAEEQHVRDWFGSDTEATHSPLLLPALPVTAAADDTAAAERRSSRRRMANRESARRSRARKQRRLVELRDSVALLERENRDLAARAEAAHDRLALALLANAALRAEAAAMSRRLAAACTPPETAVRCLVASTEMEQMTASFISEPLQ